MLDLGGADAHAAVWERLDDVVDVEVLDGAGDARLLALSRTGATFDTVVSVFQLASAPDLDAAVRRVGALLAPEGRLLFLEPGRLVGVSGRVQRMVGPPLSLLTGWRPDRDIPHALRSAGVSVTDLERHRVPTLQWWLRILLEGAAHRARPARRSDGGGDGGATAAPVTDDA